MDPCSILGAEVLWLLCELRVPDLCLGISYSSDWLAFSESTGCIIWTHGILELGPNKAPMS